MRTSICIATAIAMFGLSAATGRRARQQQASQAQQAQASKASTIDTYYRAYGACMQGRGYTVK